MSQKQADENQYASFSSPTSTTADSISNIERSLSDMLAKLKRDCKLIMDILLGRFKDLRTEFTSVTAAKKNTRTPNWVT